MNFSEIYKMDCTYYPEGICDEDECGIYFRNGDCFELGTADYIHMLLHCDRDPALGDDGTFIGNGDWCSFWRDLKVQANNADWFSLYTIRKEFIEEGVYPVDAATDPDVWQEVFEEHCEDVDYIIEDLFESWKRYKAEPDCVIGLEEKVRHLEWKVKMLEEYNHLDLKKLATDPDYYDCVMMEHFGPGPFPTEEPLVPPPGYRGPPLTNTFPPLASTFMRMFPPPGEEDDSDEDSSIILL